jgi:hypothetical protein
MKKTLGQHVSAASAKRLVASKNALIDVLEVAITTLDSAVKKNYELYEVTKVLLEPIRV